MRTVPLCYKCVSAIIEQHGGNDWSKVVGCKECDEIKSYDDARTKCPLLPSEVSDDG